MAFDFDSIKQFAKDIAEVEVLINDAKVNEGDNIKYLTYNKSAILLLSAKFETLVENMIEEYVDNINTLGICADKLPVYLKINHSTHALSLAKETLGHEHKRAEQILLLSELGELWGSETVYDKLQLSNKFNYGKHGESELIKLFKNIGIDNIFNDVIIYNEEEEYLDGRNQIDIKGKFNQLTNLRHNIIHQDASPSLTHVQIEQLKQIIYKFAYKIYDKMLESLAEIKESCLQTKEEIEGSVELVMAKVSVQAK
jgi:hypothetical protein